jgi:hypothetical protein
MMARERRLDPHKTTMVGAQLIDSLCCHRKIFQSMLHFVLLVNLKLTTAKAVFSLQMNL